MKNKKQDPYNVQLADLANEMCRLRSQRSNFWI